jgi:AraC-like DNA-binding protein
MGVEGRLFCAAAQPSANGPARLTFSTDGLAPRDALEAWHAQFGRLNDVVPAPGAPFSARVDYWRVGRFALANTSGSPARLVRTAERARRDAFDHWVLRVSRRGVVRSRSGDRAYVSRPGDLVLERLTDPYDDDWSADEWVGAMFAPEVFPALDRVLEALPRGPVPGVRAALLADFLLALDRRLPAVAAADLLPVSEALAAMIAALSPDGASTSKPPALGARVRAEQVIRANLGSARLDSRRIAALAGVSRSTLYRLFEPDGGVAGYVQRLRLDTAHAALRDPERKGWTIAAVAAQAGFHCAASFTRAFRRAYGATPGEVRLGEAAVTNGDARRYASSGLDFLEALFPPSH